jgi:hypothetical protein
MLSIGSASGAGASSLDLHPGQAIDLALMILSTFAPAVMVPACAAWSAGPPDVATIDAATGHLVVAKTAAGKTIQVTAVLDGGHTVATDLHVIAAGDRALVGIWREDARQACGKSAWIAPPDPIRELRFRASGDFGVTWLPFETYVDYWGTYRFDPSNGRLDLTSTGGNYQPKDVVLSGTVTIEKDALVLRGIWLGSKRDATEQKACAVRFVR